MWDSCLRRRAKRRSRQAQEFVLPKRAVHEKNRAGPGSYAHCDWHFCFLHGARQSCCKRVCARLFINRITAGVKLGQLGLAE